MNQTYLNPLYERSFPDPFILKFCGEYWAYCTGIQPDGRCFGILHSRDLIRWKELPGAMSPLPGEHSCYWAPEVTYDNGRFYLYYSVGNEERMHIRVAVADHPAGPFIDSGHQLTQEPFAIDAHLFTDDDGTRYLFYATDFLERSHIGTGTVRDRLLDPFTLAGERRPVVLARYDWQVYDAQRAEKGGVRWHTVEGPFVLNHKGRYYAMFSGGNWQNLSYGVGYATTEGLVHPDEWEQACDGERILPILRTLPGQVIGPGHNSVVRGPNNRQLYCVYHRWSDDRSGRLLALDPLDFAGDRLVVLGPSTTPQPAPLQPGIVGFAAQHRGSPGTGWLCEGGSWEAREGAALQLADRGPASARRLLDSPAWLLEVSLRSLSNGAGRYGVALVAEHKVLLRCLLTTAGDRLIIARGNEAEQELALPAAFDTQAFHLLRLELDGQRVALTLDEQALRWSGRLAEAPAEVQLQTEDSQAAFAGFAVTYGWQELFMEQDEDPTSLGWSIRSGSWRVRERQLWGHAPESEAVIVKGPPLAAYELVINARLADAQTAAGAYVIYPALSAAGDGPRISVAGGAAGWTMHWQIGRSEGRLPLPAGFAADRYQQLRMRKAGGRLSINWEGRSIGEIAAPQAPTQLGLAVAEATAAFDLVRLTALP